MKHDTEKITESKVKRRASLQVQSDALRLAQDDDKLYKNYLASDECVTGFGYGGSESMTLFLEKPGKEKFVRKVLSERLVTPEWDRAGQDVMLPPCPKAKSQTKYLMNLPNSVKTLFPQVLNITERTQSVQKEKNTALYYEYIYDMTFVPGIEVSQFVRNYRPSKEIVAALYGIIFRVLSQKIHSQRLRKPSFPTLEQSYFSKIEKRLALAQKTAPKTFSNELLKAEMIGINGEEMSNIPRLLQEFRNNPFYREILEPKYHCLVVGDTNTENIKIGNIEPLLKNWENFSVTNPPFTAEDLEIRFLDPRAIGFHENGVDTGADDYMYDNKPWHNSLGNYDKIHGEHFDLTYDFWKIPRLSISFHEDNPYEYSYQGIEDYFQEVMTTVWELNNPNSHINQHDPNWLVRFAFLMGTHFMAMPPFHFSKNHDSILVDDAYHQRRPLAIYAEGIKWLNLALDMLQGKVKNFHGFPVPMYLSQERLAA